MKLKFLGANKTVTGSQTLLEVENELFLIDCGLKQVEGLPEQFWKENKKFHFSPKDLSAIFLTHAHTDHSGLIPKLIAEGADAPIYCSRPTKDLSAILFRDGLSLHEGLAKKLNFKPLYSENDVLKSLELMRPLPYQGSKKIGPITLELFPAGHVLGATSLGIKSKDHSLFISGDYGKKNDPVMYPPHLTSESFDTLILEGTYGDALHPDTSAKDELISVLEKVKENSSVLIIPAFALARTQTLMLLIYEIFQRRKDLVMQALVSSPMGQEISEIYLKYADETRLGQKYAKDVFSSFRFLQWKKEVDSIHRKKGPMILISSSGMVSGGRVISHLKNFADDPNNIILLSGFQAPGSGGHELLQGAERIRVDGTKIDVKASIKQLTQLSSHADTRELLEVIGGHSNAKNIFLIHGENEQLLGLKKHIMAQYGEKNVLIPDFLESWELNDKKWRQAHE